MGAWSEAEELHSVVVVTEADHGGPRLLEALEAVADQDYPPSLVEHRIVVSETPAPAVEETVAAFIRQRPERRVEIVDQDAAPPAPGVLVVGLPLGRRFLLRRSLDARTRRHRPRPARPGRALVSVLVPAYNEERYIVAAIRSLLEQTHRELDVVVVNDGSTDRTPELLDELKRRDGRIRVLHQANQGIVGALNRAWGAAEGAFLARMDANDVSAPDRFERQLAYLDRHPDVGVVGTWLASTSPDGRPLGRVWRTPLLPGAIAWALHFETALVHASMLARREALASARAYRQAGVEHVEDYDLLVRLMDTTRMGNIPEVLYFRRELPAGITHVYRGHQAEAVRRVMQSLWSDRLGRPLAEEDAAALFALHRGQSVPPDRIPGAGAHLLALQRWFLEHRDLAPVEREAIGLDVGRKLTLLGAACLRAGQLAQGGRLLADALRASPVELPLRGARSLARRARRARAA